MAKRKALPQKLTKGIRLGGDQYLAFFNSQNNHLAQTLYLEFAAFPSKVAREEGDHTGRVSTLRVGVSGSLYTAFANKAAQSGLDPFKAVAHTGWALINLLANRLTTDENGERAFDLNEATINALDASPDAIYEWFHGATDDLDEGEDRASW